MKDFDTIFHFMVTQNVVTEHYGRGWVTGLTPIKMNKNRFNLVDSALDNYSPERRLGDYKSPRRLGLCNFLMK